MKSVSSDDVTEVLLNDILPIVFGLYTVCVLLLMSSFMMYVIIKIALTVINIHYVENF